MKITSPKTMGAAICTCVTLLLLTSCAKDADLLTDYALSEDLESRYVQNFVIDDSYITNGESSLILDVLSNDSFANPDKVKIVEISAPSSGTVIINEDKTLTYTPGTTIESEPEITQEPEIVQETESVNSQEKPEQVIQPTHQQNEESQPQLPKTPVEVVKQPEIVIEEPTKEAIKIEAPEPKTETPIKQVEQSSNDSFTYTTETKNEDGTSETQTATVNVALDYGELKAFPGAEGFGKFSVGGRGGKIIYVTNLNDSGSGSLRNAIDASGARTIIFRVSGYITLRSALVIGNGKITIAGQTSPGDGITLRIDKNKDMPCMRVKADDVIIRGIRFRPGPGAKKSILGDGLVLLGGNNIMVDHCSFSWSTDELADPYGAQNVTFQDCIFSEALMFASHIYSTDPNHKAYKSPHSMGMLIGDHSNKVTIFNSVFAHNNQRNPLIGGNTSVGGDFELINNVYYNWGAYGTVIAPGSHGQVNLINNLHIPGANTNKRRMPILISSAAKIYAKSNINDFRANNSMNESQAIGNFKSPFSVQIGNGILKTKPFDFPLAKTQTKDREALLRDVLNSAGAFKKDQVDKRIKADVLNKTGKMIDNPSEVGGYPILQTGSAYLDSDKDGMSDKWEIKYNLNPFNAKDGSLDRNGDGFSNLEDFLHELSTDSTDYSS